MKSPFGWVGGKSKLANDIVNLIPPHNIYIEVFGGALNILFAKNKSKNEVINDINSELINLHKVIQRYPQSLSDYINNNIKFVSRELFYDIRNGGYKPRNDIERASFYYYLIAQSFSNATREFGTYAKSKATANRIYKNFNIWSDRLKGVTIENKSFEKIIPLYDKETSFFYCDPPYFGTERWYKGNKFNEDSHILLYDILKDIKGKFLLSYNDCVFVREHYKDFNITKTKEVAYTNHSSSYNKVVNELFITNYEVHRLV